jgi:BirA family biotin operon repressor/biotin-[acetyl-CoA-carboxylase] ligase
MPTDRLAEVVMALPPPWRGVYFESVESTQDEARAASRAGAPGCSVFVADYQRAGRGRQGRSWLAAPGTALLTSILFRETPSEPASPWRWTSLASLSLLEAIEQRVPEAPQPAIKWPNDVMLAERKVAGVLAQTSWDGKQLIAIVGVGLNVNAAPEDLAVLPAATSLKLAVGHDVDRGQLLCTFVERMHHWLAQPLEALHSAWASRLWSRGQRVRLLDFGRVQEVVIVGAELDGSLRVRLADGTELQTTTGELLS